MRASGALVLIALACLACGGGVLGAERLAPRHLVLVTIDTLTASRLGLHGYELDTSPVLDGLAAAGVTCDAHSTTFNATYPSMVSIHTGLYARSHGQYQAVPVGERDVAAGEARTLAERLSEAGYWCGAVGSHPLWGEAPDDALLFQGWDALTLIDAPVPLVERPLQANARWTGPELERTLETWRAEAPERPLFLWAHYFDPHTERVPLLYDPPPETRDRYLTQHLTAAGFGDLAPRFTGLEAEARFALAGELASDPGAAGRLRHALNLAAYDAEVRAVDAAVGRLVDRLEGLGVLADTLLVVNADHGENLGTPRERVRAAFTHAGLEEEVVRTPWLLVHPTLPSGARVRVPTSNADLVPTLLSALGLEAPDANFDGVNVLPHVLRGEPLPRDVVFTECGTPAIAARSVTWQRIDDPDGTSRTFAWADPRGARRTLDEDARESRALARIVADFRPSHLLRVRALAHDPPRAASLRLTVPREELLEPPADGSTLEGGRVSWRGPYVAIEWEPPVDAALALRRAGSPLELLHRVEGVEAPEELLYVGATRAPRSRAGFVLRPGDRPASDVAVARLSSGAATRFELTSARPFRFVYGARRLGAPRFSVTDSRMSDEAAFRLYPRSLGAESDGVGPASLELEDARPSEPVHVELRLDGAWPSRDELALDGRRPRPGIGGFSLVVDAGALAEAQRAPPDLAAGEAAVWFENPRSAARRERAAVDGELDRALRALGY